MIDDDPYTFDYADMRREFLTRGYMAMAITSPRAQALVSSIDIGGFARERWALIAERHLRAFRERPSWRRLWLALRAAFLSGIEDSRSSA